MDHFVNTSVISVKHDHSPIPQRFLDKRITLVLPHFSITVSDCMSTWIHVKMQWRLYKEFKIYMMDTRGADWTVKYKEYKALLQDLSQERQGGTVMTESSKRKCHKGA